MGITGLGQRIQTGNLVRTKPYFQSQVNPTHHYPLKVHNSGPKLGPDQSVRPYMMSRACLWCFQSPLTKTIVLYFIWKIKYMSV